MPRFRLSLFARILSWFFLNLIVLGLVLLAFFNLQFRLAPDSPLFGRAGNRFETVAHLISAEARDASREERDAILKRYSEEYAVDFLLYASTGEQLAGREVSLPAAVLGRFFMSGPPPRPDRPPFGPPAGPPPRPPHLFALKTSNPTRYWAGVRVPLFEPGQRRPVRATLIASSDSMSGGGLFFDPWPWVVMAVVLLALSVLLWLPLVRGMTRAVAQMTAAAEQIAEERFDVRVNDGRSDELGRLGRAINHLAARLSGFVMGQRRFLGDISHELNSPLARMQFALGILEERVDPAHRGYVADAQEEVRLMSRLVSELLSYSKAGIKAPEVRLESVNLRRLAHEVIEREAADGAEVRLEVDEALEALASPELLARALANVIRNAQRYAGAAGPVTIAAAGGSGQVRVSVADCGPGVPEEELSRLFDPFYRLEPDRARSTGGAGLGLAIVKTCVEACQGTVTARNRAPSGLEVTIALKQASG